MIESKKVKMILAVAIAAHVPLAVAGGNAPYPKEKLAAFVVEKLDANSLPSAYRPKKEKGKSTLAEYGFAAQKLDEKEALLEASSSGRKLSIKILEESDAGIYACVASLDPAAGDAKAQSVVLLKRKNWNALLKGRESWQEFDGCPVVGGNEDEALANSYGG